MGCVQAAVPSSQMKTVRARLELSVWVPGHSGNVGIAERALLTSVPTLIFSRLFLFFRPLARPW